jgi:HK97 family phage major capsid protein
MKALIEKRNALLDEMDKLVNTAKVETRAMTADEDARFEAIKAEIASIDKTVKADIEARAYGKMEVIEPTTEKIEVVEERAFAEYIRGTVLENRADSPLAKADNGAVIPNTIVNRILEDIKEISPILSKMQIFNTKGTLSFPKYEEDGTEFIDCNFATEFIAPEANSGKFASVSLTGYLAEALSLISESLVNNSQFDIVSFIVRKMAESIANWMEKVSINGGYETVDGTPTLRIAGLTGVSSGMTITAAGTTAITSDELISIKRKVKTPFRANASWLLNPETLTSIKKLKYADGTYIFNEKDNTILDKPIMESENMPTATAGKKAIYFGDFSGLYGKINEQVNITVLREAYKVKHAIGVVGFVEFDSKVVEAQKIAAIEMHA